jgi:hypothetical protein
VGVGETTPGKLQASADNNNTIKAKDVFRVIFVSLKLLGEDDLAATKVPAN